MPRPKQCRRVCLKPGCTYFKPAGVPTSELEEMVVAVDELEALRLADVDGLYHEKAAEQMGVSRRTFGRIIESARSKVARALIQGMALRIEGGEIEMAEQRSFLCEACRHEWQLPFGTGRPAGCPECQSSSFHRAEIERGSGRRRRGRGSSGAAGGGAAAATAGGSAGLPVEAKSDSNDGRGKAKRHRRRRSST